MTEEPQKPSASTDIYKKNKDGGVEINESLFQHFISEQLERWAEMRANRAKGVITKTPAITISTEPGSGGHLIGHGVAQKFGFQVFEREIIKRIAENVETSTAVIESLEKSRLSGIEDFLSSLIDKKYLWPGLYLQHLMRVVNVIAKHGRAVIIGRGANFIIPPEDNLSVRLVAPLETRVKNVSKAFGVFEDDARRRVIMRQSKRHAFVRQSFHTDISDPTNYDMALNTDRLSIENAIEIVQCAYRVKYPDAKV